MAKKEKLFKLKGTGTFVVKTGGIECLDQFGKAYDAVMNLEHMKQSTNSFADITNAMKQIHKLAEVCMGKDAAEVIFASGKDHVTDYMRVFVMLSELFKGAFEQEKKELDSIQELIETA